MPVDRLDNKSAENRVALARSLVGTPFRINGRTPDGLDCVGLVALLFGKQNDIADHYPLRTIRTDNWTTQLDQILTRRDGEPQSGDAVLLSPSPLTHHLGIWTGSSLIHADARLRRVVDLSGPLTWPILGAWL